MNSLCCYILSSLLVSLPLILTAQDRMGTVRLAKSTERRVALVVGNRDYEPMRPLQNPLNDADDMAVTLRKVGFAVTIIKNADYRTLSNGITSFITNLSGSDVALFYFSGHGVGYNGQNYVIPVNADINCLQRIPNEGISIEKVLNGFEDRQVRNSFVFLDACRNLPAYPDCYDRSRSPTPTQGLTIPTNNPRGSFIAFATAEGRTADDNQQERNGLFTRELIRFLPQPNLGIRTIMDQVTTAVRQSSGQKQQPKRYEDLEGDFYFLTNTVLPSTVDKPTIPANPTTSLVTPDNSRVFTHTVGRGISEVTVVVQRGQMIKVAASGVITVGEHIGNVTPTGTNVLQKVFLQIPVNRELYNIDTKFKHGSLLYRLASTDTWKLCGDNCSFEAPKSGRQVIQFVVNDNNHNDNSGQFEVKLSVQ